MNFTKHAAMKMTMIFRDRDDATAVKTRRTSNHSHRARQPRQTQLGPHSLRRRRNVPRHRHQ